MNGGGHRISSPQQTHTHPQSPKAKKQKRDNEASEGDRSDQDLVVDDNIENPPAQRPSAQLQNGNHHSPVSTNGGENGKKSAGSSAGSPAGSEGSSSGKKKEDSSAGTMKPPTPTSKTVELPGLFMLGIQT
jgi:hypothetical protein